MSEHENEQIAALAGQVSSLTQVIKWLAGIVAAAALGGFVVASWITGVENKVERLRETDADVKTAATEMRGVQKAHSDFIGQLQQGTAVMSNDLVYIKRAVDEIRSSKQ